MRDSDIQTVTGRIGGIPLLLQGRAATILVWLIGFYFPKARAITHPLFFDYPEDKRAKDIWDEYFYGPEYLVAPSWRTGKREICLSEGNWVDFWNCSKVHQGRLLWYTGQN
ncbi:MAG: glycoside hydrolase family 31 protein [Coprothermobacterota bacterium]|nr:glycoside hydrolase family 31 protein [Coprothermobacterota bacterium]